jgi:hypothetical protein
LKEPTRNFQKGHASAGVTTTIFAATPPIIAVDSLKKTNAEISTQQTTSETPSSVYEILEPTLYSEASTPISPNESVSHSETAPRSESASTQFLESSQHSETTSNQQTASALTLIATSATTTISTATTIAPDVKNIIKNVYGITYVVY